MHVDAETTYSNIHAYGSHSTHLPAMVQAVDLGVSARRTKRRDLPRARRWDGKALHPRDHGLHLCMYAGIGTLETSIVYVHACCTLRCYTHVYHDSLPYVGLTSQK